MEREERIIDVFIERDLIKEQYMVLMEKYINLEEKHVILSDKYTELDDACKALKTEIFADIKDNGVFNNKEAIEAIITANRAKCGPMK